jgi:ABC-2 type transport system ATP-binding protein
VLQLRDLTKRFGDLVALDGVSMTVEPGRMHGFVGRNGAGKTTTMRIALGLSVPDGGTVTWRGSPPTEDERRAFGYMPEERGLYPKMKADEQVAYFGRLSGMPAAEAKAAGVRLLDELGLDDRRSEHVEKLSLGNQQRVQLATALVQGPELLVLDEPFSGLDPVGVDVLAGVLRTQVDRGAAVVFSSHQLELVERLCDVVTIIDGGRVVADGPIRTLRAERSRPLVRVELENGWAQWAQGLPDVVAVHQDGPAVLVELADTRADQAVLDAARAAGRVVRFEHVVPTLTDLFREVVAAGDAGDAAGGTESAPDRVPTDPTEVPA